MATASETIRIPANLDLQGDLLVRGSKPTSARSELVQDNLVGYDLPISDFRVFDAYQTALGTPAADDLGITTGAHGTGLPYISTGDLKAAGATTRRARILFTLPPEYVAGETVQIRLAAGMVTTVADTSATVDVEAYVSARTTLKTGSDLVSTSATTINSVTFAEKTFTVTATSLSPGDVLDLRISIAVTDAATLTAVIGAIAHAEVQCDVKG